MVAKNYDENIHVFITFIKKYFIVILLVLIGFIFISIYLLKLYNVSLNEQYPLLKINDEVKGKFKNAINNHGTINIELYDLRKFSIPQSRNYSLVPYSFDDFLKLNDSIIKARNNDTIYIIRGKTKGNYFVIGKFINEH